MKISAIVVGRNESNKLKECLKSLSFCDEILYADLDSSDNSIEIASDFSCRIFNYKEYGPSCEYTQAKLIRLVENEWVILLDPDEVISEQLKFEIIEKLPAISLDFQVGDVYVPWQFHFGKKKLKGTVWGYNKSKGIIVNKNRYEILPITHYGRRLKKGYKSFHLSNNGSNLLNHFWMDDLQNFISKHRKYLKDEGHDRYANGERMSIIGIIYNFFYQFFRCFFITKGYKDGFTGFFLSLFWVWYITNSNLSLYLVTIKSKK
jgi:glycosyltransferase involved in cell wall biosynthesis